VTKEDIYKAWAPDDSLWSPWVKPVLFACMDGPEPSENVAPEPGAISWAPRADEKVALVLDLPGDAGVALGLALAGLGYRPVPLYNALPRPGSLSTDPSAPDNLQNISIVNVRPIKLALWSGSKKLAALPIAPDAPPAFLLDANRRGGAEMLLPGRFDNRSVSFTTDFPSALFLRTHGISRVILVQPSPAPPQSDLAHTLRRWQEGGVTIQSKALENPELPQTIILQKPSWLGAMWYRFKESFGLKRNILGGYGGYISESSAG
jgi:hypothetical protein